MKKNIDWIQIASIAGSMMTVAATLLNNYANDKKMDAVINEKVAEALSKHLLESKQE